MRAMVGARSRQVALSSTVGVVQRLVQVAATLVTMPLILHALGIEGFGIWGAAASIAWMTATVDFGVGNALLTGVARAMAGRDLDGARAAVSAALTVAAGLALAVLVLAAPAIFLLASPAARPAYLIAVAAMALNIPGSLAAPIWMGLQKAYVAWSWEAAQTALTVSGYYVLIRFTADVRLYVGVTFGVLLLTNFASLSHLVLARAELRPRWSAVTARRVRSLLWRGLPYLVLGLSLTLAVHADNILALSLLGPTAAGEMAVAQRACMTAAGLLWVLTQPLWPAFTDAAARRDWSWLDRHIVRGAAIVTACAVVGSAAIVAFGGPLLALWLGRGFSLGQDVLWGMAIWIVVPALGRIPDVLLNGLGIVWFQVRVALVYSGLAFALKLALAPRLGIAGILVATGISYGCTHLPMYLWWGVAVEYRLRYSAPGRGASSNWGYLARLPQFACAALFLRDDVVVIEKIVAADSANLLVERICAGAAAMPCSEGLFSTSLKYLLGEFRAPLSSI